MAQEDDLRALGKVMDFMRGISVIFLLVNCYWFCYEAFHVWGVTLGIIDKILMNFQRTTGLFSSILWTKLFCVLFLALSCLGTKGVKEEKITWAKIWTILFSGFVFFFLNWWLLVLPIGKVGVASLYIVLPYKPNISLIHSILYNKLFAYICKFLYLYNIILADIYA